jgi:deoxyribonuclease-4
MKPDELHRGPRLGAHESTAGGKGPMHALLRGREAGCETVQIFLKAPGRWAAPPRSGEQVDAFLQAQVETGIWPVFAHGLYLLNLGTPDDELWHKSIEALADDLQRCEQLGLPGLVIHPGSHMGSGEEAGLARIAAALDEVHARLPGYRAQVWLEITAGQGSWLGYRFEQLRAMIHAIREPERVGICFDTQHALAAGYELRTREGYDATWAEFERTIGLERLRAIHLNDSKTDLGSRVDRHEQIGQGRLGPEPFRFLLNDPRLREVPMVLETEKGPDLAEDKAALALLRSLIDQ